MCVCGVGRWALVEVWCEAWCEVWCEAHRNQRLETRKSRAIDVRVRVSASRRWLRCGAVWQPHV